LGHAPATVTESFRVLDRMERGGFDLQQFFTGPGEAQEEGEIWLIERLKLLDADPEGGRHGYNSYVKVLRNLAKYAGFQGVKFSDLDIPEEENRAFTEPELDRLLAWSSRHREVHLRNRALIQFALVMGWRRSEIAALEMRDLDPANQLVFCRRPAKRGVQRWIRVRAELFSPKRPFFAWLAGRPGIDGPDTPTVPFTTLTVPDGPVWTTTRYRSTAVARMDGNGLARAMWNIGKKVGLQECNFTRCRHTCGTLMYEAGVRLRVIQKYLGHRKIESTAVYTKPRRGFVEAQVDLVPSIYTRRVNRPPQEGVGRDRY
jgi:integrase